LDPNLNRLARRAFNIAEDLASLSETSANFALPEVLRERSQGFDRTLFESQLRTIQSEIDAVSANLYGLSAEERTAIDRWAAGQGVGEEAKGDEDEEDEEDQDEESLENGADAVLSWSVGVSFARFDIRLATGERSIPSQPDPFDPLASKSPGMLPDGDAPFMPTSGVFVDDPGHPDDLATRVTAVYERVGETPPGPEDLRRSMARDFFPAHIRMYSKSRRKAPIYWQLATPSASYSVWLYIHAFSKDTLFSVQNDYVAPKLAHERRALEGLRAEAGPSPTTAQSRAIEAQASFVEELSALLDEVTRVAPLWDPDLDDGVILNFAPLWRLVPQNRAWQKELRAAWAALVAGDYDWAHLAMRLWPERVVPKCAKDRSLAIAHDLEDVFWFENGEGKWQPRVAPSIPIEALVAERIQAAVKAALASLISAPEPAGAARRGRAARPA